MEIRFKVGDRIVVINPVAISFNNFIGLTGIIVSIAETEQFPYLVQFDEKALGQTRWRADEIILDTKAARILFMRENG